MTDLDVKDFEGYGQEMRDLVNVSNRQAWEIKQIKGQVESVGQHFIEVDWRGIVNTIVLAISGRSIIELENIILVRNDESGYIKPKGIPICTSGLPIFM